jgi:hypothetical protein
VNFNQVRFSSTSFHFLIFTQICRIVRRVLFLLLFLFSVSSHANILHVFAAAFSEYYDFPFILRLTFSYRTQEGAGCLAVRYSNLIRQTFPYGMSVLHVVFVETDFSQAQCINPYPANVDNMAGSYQC